jgi:hypothetical protein
VPPTKAGQIVPRELPTGVTLYRDPAGRTPAATVLDQLMQRCQPLLIANFRLAGLKPPEWTTAGNDLLAAAPANVTSEHSLHLLVADDIQLPGSGAPSPDGQGLQRAKLLQLYHQLRSHSAAVLAFATASKDDVLN